MTDLSLTEMVKVKRTRVLPFPLKYYPRVGQSHETTYSECIAECNEKAKALIEPEDLAYELKCTARCFDKYYGRRLALPEAPILIYRPG